MAGSSKSSQVGVGTGLHNHPIYRLCRTFAESPPDYSSEDGCLALKHIDDSVDFLGHDLREQLYEFRIALDVNTSLAEHADRLGIIRMLRVGFTLWPVEFRNYLEGQAKLLTERREKINQASFYRQVFGLSPSEVRGKSGTAIDEQYSKFFAQLYEVIGEEEKRQRLALPRSNAAAMTMDSDEWIVFWIKSEGTSVQSATHNFSVIKNPHFKAAFKYWLIKRKWRNKTTSFRGSTFTGMAARAFNFLSENAGVAMPSTVTVTHVRQLVQYLCNDARSFKGEPLAMASVRGHFKILNQMFDWLMRSDVVVPDGQPRVLQNPFRAVSFKNENDYTESAVYIPEEVVSQLLAHRFKLPDEVERCFTVMMEMGLRYQDAVMLEEGCLSYDDDLEMHILRYVPMKTKGHRAKRGIDPYHEVGVRNLDVVRAIQDQERASAGLRAKTGAKLIFVKTSSDISSKVNVLSAHGFTNPIRILISEANITDYDGNLWEFNSHQCRKTVAVTMVENKAHPIEIRQFLGHLDQRTTDGIYAEVRKLRQGELNHEFFEKKFKAKVPKEQLDKFSEAERRVLYTEFALGQRDVELGQCIKHASEGPCGKRSGKTSCAICKSICVGPQFRQKWIRLVESQEQEVAQLEAAYAAAGIEETDYNSYREYQRGKELLQAYRDGLGKIQAYGP